MLVFETDNGGFIMIGYITDFIIVALLVIGITAVMGVMTNSIGGKVFGRKTSD